MNIKTASKLTLLASVVALVVVVLSSSKMNYSRVTGWKYNDKTGTGFIVKPGYKMKTPPGMVAIEGGSFTIGQKEEFVTAPRDNMRRRITVSSFFMDQYEIRNVDWREYTHWMQVVFGRTAPDLVKKAMPDQTVWRDDMAYNEPYIHEYFTHPAFNNYPVVGVSWVQAMNYCSWRTDRVNELALVRAGIIAPPDFSKLDQMSYDSIRDNFVFNTQKYLLEDSYNPKVGKHPLKDLYGHIRKANMTDGILYPNFRLPTEAEWEFAAYGIKTGKDGMVSGGRIYPWSGNQLRNLSKKYRGQMMANFVRGRGDMMGPSGNLNDHATITAPVDSYFPNDFGLYNMAGNVNEWCLDVYRASSNEDVAEYNSFRGNVYMKPKPIGKDANGKEVYAIDSLGRIQNDSIADVRNYRDGDAESNINFKLGDMSLLKEDTMDITNVLKPVINNHSRVYKGGSWKDRVYWLSPSARRYLDQNKSTDDIGFRCAMSMIGSFDQVEGKKY